MNKRWLGYEFMLAYGVCYDAVYWFSKSREIITPDKINKYYFDFGASDFHEMKLFRNLRDCLIRICLQYFLALFVGVKKNSVGSACILIKKGNFYDETKSNVSVNHYEKCRTVK